MVTPEQRRLLAQTLEFAVRRTLADYVEPAKVEEAVQATLARLTKGLAKLSA